MRTVLMMSFGRPMCVCLPACGFVSGRSRYPPKRSEVAEGDVNQGCGTFESETITAGLAPDGVYVYAEWGEGRRNRPLSQGEHGCPKQSRTLEGKPALNIAK